MNEAEVKLAQVDAVIESGKACLKQYTIKSNVIQAQKCFSEAYSLCLNILGKDHIRHIEILSLLAASHKYHIGLRTTSKDVIGLLEEMKRIQLLNYDPSNPELIETYKRLATSYAQSKKYESALKHYFLALDIQSEGPDNFDNGVAHTLERIGDIYNIMVNTKKAREFYIKALQLSELISDDFGPVHAGLQLKISRVTPIISSSPISYSLSC